VSALPCRRWAAALTALGLACAGAGPHTFPPAHPERSAAESKEAESNGGRYGDEAPSTASPLEHEAWEALRRDRGGSALRSSSALRLAARELALRAAAGEADVLAPAHVRAALARALAFDPAPVASLVIGAPDQVASRLAEASAPRAGATHAGVGVELRGGRAYAVALLSRRTAALVPFPREVAPGALAVLRGELLGLDQPSVHVTSPDGQSWSVALRRASGRRFEAVIRFDTPGRWTVEVVGRGSGGPEVAALLTVAAGAGVALEEPTRDAGPDPADPAEAEAAIAEAVNATRGRQGLPPLALAPALSALARRHSEAMAAAGQVAHVLPGSGPVGDRLLQARIPFSTASENVARGGSARDAHRAIEESPAHRQNILSADATEIGCGIARAQLPGGRTQVYLTEIFLRPVDDGSGQHLTPDALVRQALWAARERAGAPSMLSDPALEELARSAAWRMLRRGEPSDPQLGDEALHLRRKLAAVDVFVAARPEEAAARSNNVRDPRFRRVGVGVAVGDTARYGPGRLWIAVIYTD
jgi:uncharacterized protein YkwD